MATDATLEKTIATMFIGGRTYTALRKDYPNIKDVVAMTEEQLLFQFANDDMTYDTPEDLVADLKKGLERLNLSLSDVKTRDLPPPYERMMNPTVGGEAPSPGEGGYGEQPGETEEVASAPEESNQNIDATESSVVMENLQSQLHAHRRGESTFHKRHLSNALKQLPHTETQTLISMMNQFADVMHDIGMDLDADDPLAALDEEEKAQFAHNMHVQNEAKEENTDGVQKLRTLNTIDKLTQMYEEDTISLTFGKGSLGLAFDLTNGAISTVVADGQAAQLGVHPSWRVQTINSAGLPFDRSKLGAAMNPEGGNIITFLKQ